MKTNIPQCEHKNFEASVSVNRLIDGQEEGVSHLMADITITCADCKTRLAFCGVGHGVSFEKPMVSYDGTELRVPLALEAQLPKSNRMIFQVPSKTAKN